MDGQLLDRSGEIIEKFRLESLLGEGGMGQVYLAQHAITDRWVAVKILHQEYAHNEEILARIRREAKAAALIGHPNIVEIIDSGTDSTGAPFIAMELLDGQSLDEHLDSVGPMSVEKATFIVAEILDTLTAAHNRGVVHRDMKPENVYLHKRHKSVVPQVKILDFGISKFLTLEQQNMSLTRTGTVMGTPYYMSVEQAMGQKVDGRADIYSVGVILYQLLSSRLPYYDTNYNRVLLQIVAGEHHPITDIRADIPPELNAIIEKSMAKNRDERYLDCAAFKEDLMKFFEGVNIDTLFSGDGTDGIATNDRLPSRNETPAITDPKLITAAMTHSGKNETPIGTITTGEVIRPERKGKAGIFIGIAVAVIIAAAIGGYLIFGGTKKKSGNDMVAKNENTKAVPDPGLMKPEVKPPVEMKPEMKVEIPKPVLPANCIVSIKDLPDKAVVLYNGERKTLPLKIPGGKSMVAISVVAKGYENWSTTFAPDRESIEISYTAKKVKKVTGNKKPHVVNNMKPPMVEMKPVPKPMGFNPNEL
ncbi:serine/threonine protein kinase [Myxococcota bacterium]|nr:serine/threonine protein kinase [Myxococcota bacterium]MBU1379369.1 serine/threonine protein kinase [Myxococcota bacterium]MBU1497027.1 serine/threonine protein kinase [Myxococcota bacterium]